ncbi:hypothetical protein G4B88_029230 [Cannabis sativa]|uniref:PHD finger protein ALFIN-LIKE n=1 Tax=Cannabis sativa TaxID=3483 RepID=A0A7J6E1L0_CANSA|nr:hypothetical protein G4B88_029230 [Cannabis sativa]
MTILDSEDMEKEHSEHEATKQIICLIQIWNSNMSGSSSNMRKRSSSSFVSSNLPSNIISPSVETLKDIVTVDKSVASSLPSKIISPSVVALKDIVTTVDILPSAPNYMIVPPKLFELALGINFARDGMQEKGWLSLVAVHSDSWLLAIAFYFGARFGFGKSESSGKSLNSSQATKIDKLTNSGAMKLRESCMSCTNQLFQATLALCLIFSKDQILIIHIMEFGGYASQFMSSRCWLYT